MICVLALLLAWSSYVTWQRVACLDISHCCVLSTTLQIQHTHVHPASQGLSVCCDFCAYRFYKQVRVSFILNVWVFPPITHCTSSARADASSYIVETNSVVPNYKTKIYCANTLFGHAMPQSTKEGGGGTYPSQHTTLQQQLRATRLEA